ncbi:type I-C CRISPR-associated protein Cas7/Csd2 [Streptomyces mayteni]
MPEKHCDPTLKHDFVFFLDARDSNPNGDPDNGGAPRIDPVSGQGLITDVAIKRKIRNTIPLLTADRPEGKHHIYVEAGTALNTQHERAWATEACGPKATPEQARNWMCQTFYDIRMFGAVMSTGEKKKRIGRVQGPVQITFSRSLDPVTTLDLGITRVTPTKAEDLQAFRSGEPGKGKETEMGTKSVLAYGLFRGEGHFSAPLATGKNGTGVTAEDLDLFWRALTHMLEHDRSSARGDVNLRGLYVFTHDDAFGRAPARELLDLVTIKPLGHTGARSFADYGRAQIDEAAVPDGVTLKRIVG